MYKFNLIMTKEEINAWIGREIKAWRECKGWTRYQLSKHSGVQEISVKNIEEGKMLKHEEIINLNYVCMHTMRIWTRIRTKSR